MRENPSIDVKIHSRGEIATTSKIVSEVYIPKLKALNNAKNKQPYALIFFIFQYFGSLPENKNTKMYIYYLYNHARIRV